MLAGFVVAAALGAGQTSANGGREEVLAAFRRSSEAQAACNLEEYRATHAADFVIVLPDGAEETRDRMMQGCRPAPPPQQQDVKVRMYGDAAVLTATFRRSLPDGTAGPTNRLVQMWVKQNGRWVTAHSQVTAVR